MDINFINDVLKTSRTNQENIMSKIVKIKEAIETFESEEIAVTEAAYGTLAFYQSQFDREYRAYMKLLKLKDEEENRIH